MRRWIAFAIVILVLGALVWRVLAATRRPQETQPPEAGVPVEVKAAETRTLVSAVTAGGTVQGVEEVAVTAKIGGRVAAVLVDEGDRVRAGQVLIRLETSEIQTQVAQAQAGVRAADARVQMLEQGARPEERQQVADQVRQAEANLRAAQARLQIVEQGARPQERAQVESAVAQARANFETAQANYERMRMLFETGAISKAQLDQAALQRDVARAQYESAQQQLNLVTTGARPEELEMARSQVRAAQAMLDAARQQQALVEQGPRAQEVEMARAQAAQARAALAFARLQLGNATVTAPLDGTVTRRSVDPGVLVGPGSGSLVTVSQIDTVEVALAVSETDVGKVRAGQPVAVRVDAYPGRAFTGKVAEVGAAADPRVRTFTVKVRVGNPEHLLRPGMFARGKVTVERREQVLVIPRDAVTAENGQSSVFVAEGGKARARRIRLGITSGPVVEVLSGLQKGETVIVAGQSGLVDGTPVIVR